MHGEAAARRRELVDWLVREGRVRDRWVEDAFRAVPRHVFLPGASLDAAYADEAVPVKQSGGRVISSASQPSMVAIMLEQLDLRPGDHVLEVGAGTGYNAALMTHLVGPRGIVTTVDLDADLVAQAARNLATADYFSPRVVQGDGAYGYSPNSPYDRIILTVGASDVSPAWVDQLKPTGRLVLPLAIRITQRSVALEARGDHLESVSSYACGFVPLRGLLAGPESHLEVAAEVDSYYLTIEDAARVDPRRLVGQLASPGGTQPTGFSARGAEVFDGLLPWLELRSSDAFIISAEANRGERQSLLPVAGGLRSTVGLMDSAGFALLGTLGTEDSRASELVVHGFGDAARAVSHLVALVRQWGAIGRPGGDDLRISVYPADVDYRPRSGEHVVAKRWSTVVLAWRRAGTVEYL